MTIVVPILSHPLSRPPSRLPHLPRSLRRPLCEGHPCPDTLPPLSVGGASYPDFGGKRENEDVGG